MPFGLHLGQSGSIGSNTFDQISQASSPEELNRIYAFINTGKQDGSNDQARALISKRMQAFEAEKKQEDAANQLIEKQKNDVFALQSGYTKTADDLTANLDSNRMRQTDSIANVARNNLAQQLNQNRTQANQRGLLYSGVKSGHDATDIGNYSQAVGVGKQAVFDKTNAEIEGYRNAAAQSGLEGANNQLQMAQQKQGMYDKQYEQAINRQKQNQSGWAGLSQGVGGLFGSVLGRGK